MTDNTMLAEPLVADNLEPSIRISADLTCLNPACLVCGPVVEAAAAGARREVAS